MCRVSSLSANGGQFRIEPGARYTVTLRVSSLLFNFLSAPDNLSVCDAGLRRVFRQANLILSVCTPLSVTSQVPRIHAWLGDPVTDRASQSRHVPSSSNLSDRHGEYLSFQYRWGHWLSPSRVLPRRQHQESPVCPQLPLAAFAVPFVTPSTISSIKHENISQIKPYPIFRTGWCCGAARPLQAPCLQLAGSAAGSGHQHAQIEQHLLCRRRHQPSRAAHQVVEQGARHGWASTSRAGPEIDICRDPALGSGPVHLQARNRPISSLRPLITHSSLGRQVLIPGHLLLAARYQAPSRCGAYRRTSGCFGGIEFEEVRIRDDGDSLCVQGRAGDCLAQDCFGSGWATG